MTITHTTEDTPIAIGQWVHGPSKLKYGLHSMPRQVTRFAGQRVHYTPIDGPDSFMLRRDVLIVCDTRDEAISVYELSLLRDQMISARIKEVADDFAAEYEGHLQKLIAEGFAA